MTCQPCPIVVLISAILIGLYVVGLILLSMTYGKINPSIYQMAFRLLEMALIIALAINWCFAIWSD